MLAHLLFAILMVRFLIITLICIFLQGGSVWCLFMFFFFCGLNLLFRNLSIHSLCSFYIVFVFFPNQFLRLLCILALYHVWQVYLPNVLLSVGFYPTVLISLVIKYIFTSLSFLFSLSLHLQITLLVSYIVILGLFYCLRSYTICQLNLY